MQFYVLIFICSGTPAAEAEFLYISEVERLDGFGQESFPVKVKCYRYNGFI